MSKVYEYVEVEVWLEDQEEKLRELGAAGWKAIHFEELIQKPDPKKPVESRHDRWYLGDFHVSPSRTIVFERCH